MKMSDKIEKIFLDRCLYYFDFDLITGIVETDIIDKYGNNYTEQLGLASPCTFDELMERSYDSNYFGIFHVANDGVNVLNQNSLIKAYNAGKTMVEASIFLPKTNKYYRIEYYLVKDDFTGNPHVFANCIDSTEEENSREIIFGELQNSKVDIKKISDLNEQLRQQREAKNELYSVLETMAEVYYSLHVLDLVNDSFVEYYAQGNVKEYTSYNKDATATMRRIMEQATVNEYRDEAIEFSDLNTLPERMRNKKLISAELLGRGTGWFVATFITLEADDEGRPTKVVFATHVIDEEKKQQEKLIRKTQTDELTSLFNRRAYEDDICEHNNLPDREEFVYISLDVNGLKTINDTIGHVAGDEMLVGTCSCMSKVLGPHGKLYRIGGDEFVAIVLADKEKLKLLLDEFDSAIEKWSGKLIKNISVSYGVASRQEYPKASVRELASIAEKRMYEAKSSYYRRQGVDRRGQQDAHKALCELYTKILGVNLTDDTYQIINMDINEQTKDKGFADRISEWLTSFGKSGQVHPDDLDEYLRLTDINYMRDYFKGKKTSLHIFYRRKFDDSFKQVMMEIIPANDYRDDNQSLFLYVKNIDK